MILRSEQIICRYFIFTAVLQCLCFAATGYGQNTDEWSAFPGDGFVPKNARNVHDPAIIHFGDRYFCFSTGGNRFGVLRSSPDLIDWTVIGPVMPETPQWLRERIPEHRSIWAPEIVRIGDGLRMYYCASEFFGSNTSYIGVAECPRFDPVHPTDGWHDLGMVLSSQAGKDDFNAIDPSVLADDRGRTWMFYGSFFSGIYAIELNATTGKLLDPAHGKPILVARNPDDRMNAIEGASIIHRDPYYYLFCSFGVSSQGVRSTYSIGVGRSKSIEGPFVDLAGKAMVDGGHTSVLKASAPMFGPGGSMAFDDNGRWLLVHHYYDGRHFWADDKWGLPTLQVRELIWSDDGWPLPGRPIQPIINPTTKPSSPAGRWKFQVDFTEPVVVTLDEHGSVSGGNINGTWTLEKSHLLIDWPTKQSLGKPRTDTLYLSEDGQYCVGRIHSGAVIRGAKLSSAGQ